MKDFPAPETADWHRLEAAEATRLLQSDCEHGLAEAEARRRQARFSPNAAFIQYLFSYPATPVDSPHTI